MDENIPRLILSESEHERLKAFLDLLPRQEPEPPELKMEDIRGVGIIAVRESTSLAEYEAFAQILDGGWM